MSGGTLASPCVRNCCLDEQDICLGCGRSLDEIRDWSATPDPGRQQILERAAARRAARSARLRAMNPPGSSR
jgi:predicted Fe-S protein YdhL (DUF1289 family)